MATIWDADILIWAASQIVEARDAGLRTSRLMADERLRDSHLRRSWRIAARLPAPEGRARPAPIHHRRDLDPPDRRKVVGIALVDQRVAGARPIATAALSASS